MAKIKINDIAMYYELHGSGESVVFIAGFGADHTVWSMLVDQFKDQYQVVVFDNRGAGQTDVPDGPYSIDAMTNDVIDLCAKLGIKKAHFIGNSMGGFILQALALRAPELVKSAVISHSAATIQSPFHIYLAAQLEFLKSNMSLAALIKASCSWIFSLRFLLMPGMLHQLIQTGLENPYPFTIKGYEGQFAALEGFDSRDWANQIHVPTLLLTSDQDLIFSDASVKALAEQIPGAKYYCFSECGHLPQIEHPEELSQIIQAFITNG
ncbi:MAG: alpha/beta fold hydrolase [Legionellales bacterium]